MTVMMIMMVLDGEPLCGGGGAAVPLYCCFVFVCEISHVHIVSSSRLITPCSKIVRYVLKYLHTPTI